MAMNCDTCGADSDNNSTVQWVDNQTARCSSCVALRTRIEAETVAAIVAEVTERRDRAAKHRHAPYGDGCDDYGREKALDDLLDWLGDWGKS